MQNEYKDIELFVIFKVEILFDRSAGANKLSHSPSFTDKGRNASYALKICTVSVSIGFLTCKFAFHLSKYTTSSEIIFSYSVSRSH